MAKIRQRVSEYAAGFPERQTARGRLPRWAVFAQMAIWIPSFTGFFMGWFYAFDQSHHVLHPGVAVGKASSLAEDLITFPGLAAAIPISLIWTNLILWLLPPLRRANEIAAAGVKDLSFRNATGGLLKTAYVMIPPCLFLTLLGVWEPWR